MKVRSFLFWLVDPDDGVGILFWFFALWIFALLVVAGFAALMEWITS